MIKPLCIHTIFSSASPQIKRISKHFILKCIRVRCPGKSFVLLWVTSCLTCRFICRALV